MIKNLDISGVHTNVNEKVQKYVTKKIGRLDRYIPRHARESAHAEVIIKESNAKERRQHTCEVILKLPQETLATKETTMNVYAAIDIVEAKLKNQLKKYKEKHASSKLHRRALAHIKRGFRRPA